MREKEVLSNLLLPSPFSIKPSLSSYIHHNMSNSRQTAPPQPTGKLFQFKLVLLGTTTTTTTLSLVRFCYSVLRIHPDTLHAKTIGHTTPHATNSG